MNSPVKNIKKEYVVEGKNLAPLVHVSEYIGVAAILLTFFPLFAFIAYIWACGLHWHNGIEICHQLFFWSVICTVPIISLVVIVNIIIILIAVTWVCLLPKIKNDTLSA